MTSNQTSDSQNTNLILNTSYGDTSNDDDGFFSDSVPGSLSKSLLALNKYVKKNLLYESDEYENDSNYFSKESSPNNSRFKYDSDSLKSDGSSIKNENVKIKITKITVLPNNADNKEQLENVSKLTDDYKCMQLLDKGFPNVISDSETTVDLIATTKSNINKSTSHERVIDQKYQASPSVRPKKHIIQEKYETETNTIPEHTFNDQCSNRIVSTATICNEHNNTKYKNIFASTESSEHNNFNNRIESNSISLNNLETISESDNEDNKPTKVVLREKSNDERYSENRHTIHAFSDWGNRTDVYPDVYAPLPYKSPRRYVESDVNIHYRCPVRHDPLPLVPERELARQQAEHMKRLYREQRRNKYLQELQDMQNRRHQDNFTPSQKSVVPLNRYDEANKVVAKALYTFNGQTQRELSFRKGDLIHVRRQIDNNWYEGELHGRIGLFPYNYVEIQKGDIVQTPKKPVVVEGRARAKFDFTAQTNLELPLKKGEVVVLTRRIDQNWWEGKNGSKTGIFPDSYITVLQEPSQNKSESQPIVNSEAKPVASPAAHGLLNGTAKRSMGPHSYTPQPNSPALSNAPQATQPLPGYVAKPAQATLTPSERGYGPPTGQGVDLNNTEPLYVDTNAEAIPYRAMYKYRPQNPDELELNEGDTVYVLEKCDDGWYVGSSQRTGRFGTFPGNYVERI